MFLKKLRDASAAGGAGGGGNAASGGEPGGSGGGTTPASGGSGGGSAPAGELGGGGPGNLKPAGDIDYKAEHEKLTGEMTTLKEQLTEKTKGLDSAGDKIKALKHLETALKENPRTVIENLAKDHKLNIKFGDETDGGVGIKVPDDLSAMSKDDLKNLLNEAVSTAKGQGAAEAEKRVMERIAPELDLAYQESMRRRHDDWDDGEEGRQNIGALRLSNEIRMPEIRHYAWKGMNLPAILADHKVEVIKEYEEVQRKKTEAMLSPGGKTQRTPAATTGAVELKDLVSGGDKKTAM